MDIFATIRAIVTAELNLVRISTPILLVIGNIGEILNIVIFVQRIFRNNSCVIYLLAASFTRLLYINYTVLLNGLSLGYSVDPGQTSLAFCKAKFYLFIVAAALAPSFIVLACFDRLMLSSMNANRRQWTQPRFAYRLIASISIFWLLFSIHILFGATIIYTPGLSYCLIEEGSYAVFFTFYSIIVNYLLPPTLMIILGLLTIVNVRQAQRRVCPLVGTGYIQRKDRSLLRMLLFQVLVHAIFTILPGVFQIYGLVTANWEKDPIWQAWDLFFLALALLMSAVPYCTGFYVYTLTASIFKKELKRVIIRCYRQIQAR